MRLIPQNKLDEYLDKMSNSIYGKAMVQYLEQQIDSIDSVKDIDTFEEAIGRKIAIKYFIKTRNRILKSEEQEHNFSEYE